MNKITAWMDRHKILSYAIIIFLFFYIVLLKPYKPTNPSNPLFVDSWFQMNDYNFRPWALRGALTKLFPVGTSMDYVDLMLVKRGDARKGLPGKFEGRWYLYYFQPWYLLPIADGLFIYVEYDANKKVRTIIFGPKPIVGDPKRRLYDGDYNVRRK